MRVKLRTRQCDACASGQESRRVRFVQIALLGNWKRFWFKTRLKDQELIMDSFGYSFCEQCEEENFFRDGAKCARCLSVSYVPRDDADNEEEPLSIASDRLAAA